MKLEEALVRARVKVRRIRRGEILPFLIFDDVRVPPGSTRGNQAAELTKQSGSDLQLTSGNTYFEIVDDYLVTNGTTISQGETYSVIVREINGDLIKDTSRTILVTSDKSVTNVLPTPATSFLVVDEYASSHSILTLEAYDGDGNSYTVTKTVPDGDGTGHSVE